MKFKGIGTLNGKTEHISLEADTKEAALKQMTSMGYSDVSVVEEVSFLHHRAVGNKDLSIVFRQLASFSAAGESFLTSLSDVADVTRNPLLKNALLDIRHRIEMGSSIPDAFSQHSFFSPVVINLLNVGDRSGEMETVLEQLAQYLEQITDIENGVSSALLYPKIIATVMVLAMFFVITFIFPEFRKFYTDMHIEMPAITKMLYALSDFINNDWFIVIPGIFAAFYFLKNTKRYIPHIHDQLCISLPIIKNIMINMYMFRFCKTMQILTQASVDILETLKLVANAMENHIYVDVIEKTIPMVRIGESISSSMRRNDEEHNFDIMAMAFLTTGENTQNIGDLMEKAAKYYQKNLNVAIDNFGKQIEPIMLIFISFFVLALVASIYLPIFRMSQITGAH